MERLLADATKLTGVKYDMNNLGDVYSAIHAIQGDLGLTGVAAAEASETFSGSFGAMKASAENLLANLAMGENVEPAMAQLATSAGTFFFNNLVPMVGNVIKGIPAAASGFIQAAGPSLMENGKGLINGIITGAQEEIPVLLDTVPTMISDMAGKVTESLPTLIESGGEIALGIVDGIAKKIPELAENAGEIVGAISGYLQENIPTIGEKGGEIMESIGQSLVSNLPKIVMSIGKLSLTILQALAKLIPTLLKAGANLIGGLARGMGGGALGLVRSAMAKIKGALEEPIQKAKDTIDGVIEGIKGFFPLNIGNIFSNFNLPHIHVSGGSPPFGIAGKGTPPSFSVEWYAKAMNEPYMFNRASLIGVGEAGDEMVYGRSALLRDIKEATGGGQNITLNVTVNGAEDPEVWADRFVREFMLKARTA